MEWGIELKNVWCGKNVKLRAVELSDLDGYFNAENGFDTEIQRAYDIITFPVSKEKMKEKLETLIKKQPENDEFMFIIEDNHGNSAGSIVTFSCDKRNGTFKYGIRLNKEFWGKGCASEAVIIVLRYFFHELRYQKVNVYIYSFNDRSVKFHKKLGFKYEGTLRRMLYTDGKYYDEIFYGMTSEEFDSIYKQV